MGPAAGGDAAGAAHGPIDLLGRHAGDQGAAAGAQLGLDGQLVPPHQAAAGVQQGQFAAAIGGGEGPLDLQGGRRSSLVPGGSVRAGTGLETKPGLGSPGCGSGELHGCDRGTPGAWIW